MSPEGILLVDKAANCTSFDVVAKVRKALGVKRVGHAGTLDPFATGLLIVLVGRYTKLSDFFLNEDKAYKATLKFGIGTDSHDSDGQIISRGDASDITKVKLQASLEKFRGPISQIPPKFSAIKISGQRAYKLARKGEEVELKARDLTIHELEILSFDNPFAELKIKCSKGTYIRSLARDIGEDLGVSAHLSALRRASSGKYLQEDAISQKDLADKDLVLERLISGKKALEGHPFIDLNTTEAQKLRHSIKIKL